MSLSTPAQVFTDKIQMQHRLFAALSNMFGREVPLYDKSLLVNKVCNQAVVTLLSQMHQGFQLTEDQLDKTSGERHGAIRIGTAEEYRWVAGFFAAFDLKPHNFYDMTSLGGKSQPIIATAFRSKLNPEHRVFCSLLMTDGFDPKIKDRVDSLLATRQVFSERAKELITRNEQQSGLEETEANELIREGTDRIFKWTGRARDFQLYNELCNAGLKIAADIACFESHHLNHLTPNTFCMDLYTAAMKFCLGEMDRAAFERAAGKAFNWLRDTADRDYLKLHFRHLTGEAIEQFAEINISDEVLARVTSNLAERLTQSDLDLSQLKHAGFKDFTEGPATGVPVLLRQDSYKALTEPVTFTDEDGTETQSVHTARFGEIEQRFYATTPLGRELYDRCLTNADEAREKNPGLVKQDNDAYLSAYADAFLPFPKTLPEMLEKKLVYGRYTATAKGLENAGSINSTDLQELVKLGYVRYEGLRYEDFLPFSAAGIFASNLGQYGTKSSVAEKPVYTKETLEAIMDRKVVDPNDVYSQLQEVSIEEVRQQLGLSS